MFNISHVLYLKKFYSKFSTLEKDKLHVLADGQFHLNVRDN